MRVFPEFFSVDFVCDFFFQAEDGIRDGHVTGVQTCALPIWATTVSTQVLANDTHWMLLVVVAILVGAVCGLLNGIMVSFGKIVPFIATLAMMASARGLAEIITDRQTQRIKYVPEFLDNVRGNFLGIPRLVWIFVAVAIVAWFVLNRTTFGRRTVAVGGNPEAARLAGINVKWHTVWLYTLAGSRSEEHTSELQ